MVEKSRNSIESIQAELIAKTSEFLIELGRERAVRGISLSSFLERDLGIDSLGRVELFHRIEEAFAVRLPESLMAEAETLEELAQAILKSEAAMPSVKAITANVLNQTAYDPSDAESLVEVLLKRASKEPNRPHIYLQDEKGDEKIITYDALLRESSKIAAGLHELGITEGDTVAIMLPTCEDFFYTFFGILLIGAIPVPIYPPFRPDRIEEYAIREAGILRNAEVRLLITFQKAERLSELLKVFIASLQAVTTVANLRQSKNPSPMISIRSQMPALIQYTSGSTSAPKGVLLNHQNLLANIRAAGKGLQISSSDVGVSWLPLYHDMGLIGSWFISFYHANPVVIMSPLTFLSRPERWLWTIHYHRATISAAPNFAYELCIRRIKESSIQGLDLSSWRLSLNGAEAVNPRTIESFIKKFAPFGFKSETMFPVYGLAESSVALAFPPLMRGPKIDKINRDLFEKEQKAVPVDSPDQSSLQFVCCGKAISDHEIRIVDGNNNIVAERKIGYLHFRGPSSMVGYYHQPEATEKITHGEWLDSGDLAYQAEGEIYLTGRKKDLIIKAGRNLYPDEIEDVASQVRGIRKGCVVAFGTADQKIGTEKLVIVAEHKDVKQKDHAKLKGEITEKISIVLGIVPDEIVLVPPKIIPKTSSGKLQRAACKQAFLDKKLVNKPLPVWIQVSKLFCRGLAIKFSQFVTSIAKLCYTAYVGVLVISSVFFLWCLIPLISFNAFSIVCKWLAGITLWLAGCPIKIINKENLPSVTPIIYISNHASYLDAIVLLAVVPKNTQFVAKKELLKVPFLKSIIQKLKTITVDRIDFSTNLLDAKIIVEKIKQEKSVIFFPEGTFTYATGLRPFKLGAFKVAVETSTPICPIAINGTRHILRGDKFILSPKKIVVTIGLTYAPSSKEWGEVTRLHALARAEIIKACGEQAIDY